jgi:hypothetical protein
MKRYVSLADARQISWEKKANGEDNHFVLYDSYGKVGS